MSVTHNMADILRTTFSWCKNVYGYSRRQQYVWYIHLLQYPHIIPLRRAHCHAAAESVTPLQGLSLFLSKVECSPTSYDVKEMQWIVMMIFFFYRNK